MNPSNFVGSLQFCPCLPCCFIVSSQFHISPHRSLQSFSKSCQLLGFFIFVDAIIAISIRMLQCNCNSCTIVSFFRRRRSRNFGCHYLAILHSPYWWLWHFGRNHFPFIDCSFILTHNNNCFLLFLWWGNWSGLGLEHLWCRNLTPLMNFLCHNNSYL